MFLSITHYTNNTLYCIEKIEKKVASTIYNKNFIVEKLYD